MGTVEAAIERAADGFERIVALKRLLPEGARNPRHKEMFWREARLAALLAHPNVVHAFAFGELYGELFLAMEYVEGESLSRVLAAAKRQAVEIEAPLVAHVLAEVCEGLHAAHELRDAEGRALNVVHRDVSPHNVMLAYDGHVKLLDFGVAKFEGLGSTQTRTGEVKGKMAYMSPEQALGDQLDRRSDLFSVGAVLFECLTGNRMWGPGTDLEVMRKLALEDPPRLDDGVPGARAGLVRLHEQLVARDPASRPATAREVAERLRAVTSEGARAAGAGSVRSLMLRLFREQADRRRAELTQALEREAPDRADSLRRSLEPGVVFDRPTLTEPVIVPPAPEEVVAKTPPTLSPRRRGRTTTTMVAVALVAAVAAAVAASAARTDPRPAPPPTAIVPPPAPAPTLAPTLAPAPTPTPAPTHSRAPELTHPARPAAKAGSNAKPPDVDPTPF